MKLKDYYKETKDVMREYSNRFFNTSREDFLATARSTDDCIDTDENDDLFDIASGYIEWLIFRCLCKDSEEETINCFESLVRDLYEVDQEMLNSKTFGGETVFELLVGELTDIPGRGIGFDGFYLWYGVKCFMKAFLSMSQNGKAGDLIPWVIVYSTMCSVFMNTISGEYLLPYNLEYMGSVLKRNIKLLKDDLKEMNVWYRGMEISGYECIKCFWIPVEELTDVKLEEE